VSWRRNKQPRGIEHGEPTPRQTFHVLRGEQELQSALLRAARTERGSAGTMARRADRYESMLATALDVEGLSHGQPEAM